MNRFVGSKNFSFFVSKNEKFKTKLFSNNSIRFLKASNFFFKQSFSSQSQNTKTFNILVLGGYGIFGKALAQNLGKNEKVKIFIAGRNIKRAEATAQELSTQSKNKMIGVQLNTLEPMSLSQKLKELDIFTVIDTSGPFDQNYFVAKTCINNKVHYIDISDSPDYVFGIQALNEAAKQAQVSVISGASSVVALSSSVVEYMLQTKFSRLDTLHYSLSVGNQIPRGIGAIQSVLSNTGKSFEIFKDNKFQKVLTWSNLEWETFPGMANRRLVGNYPVVDLKLFPTKYPSLQTIQFKAGVELPIFVRLFKLLSYLRNWKLIPDLTLFTKIFISLSNLVLFLGTTEGGMNYHFTGLDKQNPSKSHQVDFFIWSGSGHGVHIPGIPAVALINKLIHEKNSLESGAQPCLGLVSFEEIQELLACYDIIIDENSTGHPAARNLPVFEQGLGQRLFHALPPLVSKFHASKGLVEGHLTVTRGNNIFANLIAVLGRLPKPSPPNQPTFVRVRVDGPSWYRTFGSQKLTSHWVTFNGLVVEKFLMGLVQFGFQLKPMKDKQRVGFYHKTKAMWVLYFIPVPSWFRLSADGITWSHVDGKGWYVRVEVCHPLFGKIITYEGDVRVIE